MRRLWLRIRSFIQSLINENAAEKICIKEADSFYDLCYELADRICVEHEKVDDVDHYFGISSRMIEDDETGKQFEDRVE